MGLEKQGSNPTGFWGNVFGRLMNKYHTRLYRDYFTDNVPPENASVLDIGCGGGKLIHFFYNYPREFKLYGIDPSTDMVHLSRKVNKKGITEGVVVIKEGTVMHLKYEEEKHDLITAMETIQFWPDIAESFSEIFKVLKYYGEFVIINRYPKENTKWWHLAKVKSITEYYTLLKQAGFEKITVDLKYKKGWIIVKAVK